MKEDCYANTIYGFLASNNIRFSSVHINSEMFGEGGYSFEYRRLYFKTIDSFKPERFFHEMFHLFQSGFAGETPENTGMMEYERTLFTDIMAYIKARRENDMSLFANRETPTVINGVTAMEIVQTYKNWLQEITKGGTIYPGEISQKDFHAFSEIFKKYSRPYGHLHLSNTYIPKSLQKALELVKQSCK